jgi:hypothetical protein
MRTEVNAKGDNYEKEELNYKDKIGVLQEFSIIRTLNAESM